MKRMKIMAFGAAAVAVLSLTGCDKDPLDNTVSSPEIEATDIAIVSGYHRNAVTPPVDDTEILNAIEYSMWNVGSVTVVVNDGDPSAVVDYTVNAQTVANQSEARLEQQVTKAVEETTSALAGARANDPEVDTLEAIRQAARGLTSEDGDKCMYILDSGLSTAGDLNVLAGNLHRLDDIEPIVERLQEDHALPDLSGVQVVWIGLGDVAGEQADLTSRNRDTLQRLWEAVLNASGAEVTFKNLPIAEEADIDESLPEVTPVEIVQDDDDFDPLAVNQVKPLFNGDEATFVDRDEAVAELAPVVDYLLEHPDYTVILAGTTATAGTNEHCKKLSLDRAEAVRQLMVGMGAPENQIVRVVGLGYEHEFHINDLNADGSLNEDNAPENRAVLVVGTATEAAQILEKY